MFVAAATIEDDVNAAGMVDRGRMARRKAGLRMAIFSVGRAKEPRHSSGAGHTEKFTESNSKRNGNFVWEASRDVDKDDSMHFRAARFV